MTTAKITFSNGTFLSTSINGTEAEITDYYLGKWFNLGTEKDDMQKAVIVEIDNPAYANFAPWEGLPNRI